MANNKDFKVKNGIKPTAYHEGLGTFTTGTTIVGTGSVFSENRYDGDGATNQAISTGIDLSVAGSFCWIETNSNSGGGALYYDTGTGVRTFSTEAEAVDTTSPLTLNDGSITVTSFIGEENDINIENVVWGFKKASKMAEAIEYSGSSSGVTVSHNLGQTPGMIMIKATNNATQPWAVWHAGIHSTTSESDGLRLDSTAGESVVGSGYMTNVNSSSFTVSNASRVGNGGINYVAFVFGNDTDGSGYVKCGSYTGTGNGGSHHVECGWKPKWILVKSKTTAQGWVISSEALGAGTASEVWEITGSASYTWQYYGNLTPTDTGFTVSGTSDLTNTSGVEYMFTAIREGSSVDTATLDLSTGSVFEITTTSDIQIGLSNPAASGTVSAATLLLEGASDGYDIANASYDSVELSVSAQETSPNSIFFKPDGTKLFLMGDTGDDVNEYALSTAWDITSATLTTTFSVSSEETGPHGLWFKPDGTKMYVVGTAGDDVNEYNLSTAWDVSSASYLQNFSVGSEETAPRAVTFKPDGTKMFIVGTTGDDINEYNLSTAWDVSTATFVDATSLGLSTNPYATVFNNDGTKLFSIILNDDAVYEFSLTTAYDASTLSFTRSFSVLSEDTTPAGLFFKSDGTKMYVSGKTSDKIFQYNTAIAPTIRYDTTLQWGGGTAPDSPALGETDVMTFATRDGGTTYQAALSIDGAK